MQTTWDVLIKNALVFDGTGETPSVHDIALKAGRIAAKGQSLPETQAAQVIDGDGQWLMPGLLDIHTHLDLEVELDPSLTEVVRHGTTTVLFGNCSLGTSFGKQMDTKHADEQQNPIVDCFTRVENIPKAILAKCVGAITWDNTADYMDHFDNLALGPNVASFLPHSMLRVEVMGLEASISRKPTQQELAQMEALLEKAMDQGYLGLSTDGLPFHYLANSPNTDKRIPTQFAPHFELKRLLNVVRKHERVWQTTPIIENRLKAFLYFTFTSGRLFGKTLKTTALSAMEFTIMPKASNLFLSFAKLMNGNFFKGNIHFQALGTNFRVWSDGLVSPVYEEMDAASQWIAKEYDDVAGRRALFEDASFVDAFRKEWYHGRKGWNIAHLKSKLGAPDSLVIRDFALMIFEQGPVPQWSGESLKTVMTRLLDYQQGNASAARSDTEQEVFNKFPTPLQDEVDFLIHLLKEYDKNFRFWMDIANEGNTATLGLLLHENTLPGFNDSGAHITNMAFFDANLNALKLAYNESLETVAKMVQRLTTEPAKFFSLDVGTLNIGAQADITMINPAALAAHDTDAKRTLEYRELFAHQQLINRSDGVVSHVFINGEQVWHGDKFTAALGSKRLGRALRAGEST